MRALQEKELRTQEVANRENLTATEAVRQLQRLADSGLIRRLSDGSYINTEYGKIILHLSRSIEFVFRYREYFSTHDLLVLPQKLINRIGELSEAQLSMDTMKNLDLGQRILSEAREFSWGIGEGHIPDLMVPVMNSQMRKGVTLRFITPEGLVPPSSPERNVEIRGLSTVPVILVLSEKEAVVCFRFREGRVDYAGFSGKDEDFRSWVRDLFLDLWEKSSRYQPRNSNSAV